MELIRQRDSFQQKIFELNKRLRTVQHENHELDEQCKKLTSTVDDLEHQLGDPKLKKHQHDLLNQKRKPFISTVRSGEFLPSTLKSIENVDSSSSTSKCTCQATKNDYIARLNAEHEMNRVKTNLELIDLYKAQVSKENDTKFSRKLIENVIFSTLVREQKS